MRFSVLDCFCAIEFQHKVLAVKFHFAATVALYSGPDNIFGASLHSWKGCEEK